MLLEDLAVLWLPSDMLLLLQPLEDKVQGMAGTVAMHLCSFVWGS